MALSYVVGALHCGCHKILLIGFILENNMEHVHFYVLFLSLSLKPAAAGVCCCCVCVVLQVLRACSVRCSPRTIRGWSF